MTQATTRAEALDAEIRAGRAFRAAIEARLGGPARALEVCRAAMREDDQDSPACASWWAAVRAGQAAAELAR